MAVFNFPIRHPDHPIQALRAARAIQRCWAARRQTLIEIVGTNNGEAGVAIGIDTGQTTFGEFGGKHQDLTAIGTVVNRASRAQSAAADQIMLTKAVYARSGSELGNSQPQDYQLKGFDAATRLWAT
jgi:class 3 adenylate cyclase